MTNNKPLPEPTLLTDMICIQPDAIVSRMLLTKKDGTVTLFAFDHDQFLSEHTAPYDALVHILEGDMTITINGHPHHLTNGQIILLPANQPHALTANHPTKMLLTMIKSP